MNMLTQQAKERLYLKDSQLRDLQSQCDLQAIIIDDLMRGCTDDHQRDVLLVRGDMLDLLMKSTLGINNDYAQTQQTCDRLRSSLVWNPRSDSGQQRQLMEQEILKNLAQRAQMTEQLKHQLMN